MKTVPRLVCVGAWRVASAKNSFSWETKSAGDEKGIGKSEIALLSGQLRCEWALQMCKITPAAQPTAYREDISVESEEN